MSETRKFPRTSRVDVKSIGNHPDPKYLDIFVKERERQYLIEMDLFLIFKKILTSDEFNVIACREELFGEDKCSLNEIGKRFSMSDDEVVMLLRSAWGKILAHNNEELKKHLSRKRART